MFSINRKNNTIKMTRGDSASFDLVLDGYTMVSGDAAVFTVKKRIKDYETVLQVNAGSNGRFDINSSDTYYLEPGSYVYDIKILTKSNKVYTVILGNIVLERGVNDQC